MYYSSRQEPSGHFSSGRDEPRDPVGTSSQNNKRYVGLNPTESGDKPPHSRISAAAPLGEGQSEAGRFNSDSTAVTATSNGQANVGNPSAIQSSSHFLSRISEFEASAHRYERAGKPLLAVRALEKALDEMVEMDSVGAQTLLRTTERPSAARASIQRPIQATSSTAAAKIHVESEELQQRKAETTRPPSSVGVRAVGDRDRGRGMADQQRWSASLTRAQQEHYSRQLVRSRGLLESCDASERFVSLAERIVLKYNACAMRALAGNVAVGEKDDKEEGSYVRIDSRAVSSSRGEGGVVGSDNNADAAVSAALGILNEAIKYIKPPTLQLFEEHTHSANHDDRRREGTAASGAKAVSHQFPLFASSSAFATISAQLFELEDAMKDPARLASLFGCPSVASLWTEAELSLADGASDGVNGDAEANYDFTVAVPSSPARVRHTTASGSVSRTQSNTKNAPASSPIAKNTGQRGDIAPKQHEGFLCLSPPLLHHESNPQNNVSDNNINESCGDSLVSSLLLEVGAAQFSLPFWEVVAEGYGIDSDGRDVHNINIAAHQGIRRVAARNSEYNAVTGGKIEFVAAQRPSGASSNPHQPELRRWLATTAGLLNAQLRGGSSSKEQKELPTLSSYAADQRLSHASAALVAATTPTRASSPSATVTCITEGDSHQPTSHMSTLHTDYHRSFTSPISFSAAGASEHSLHLRAHPRFKVLIGTFSAGHCMMFNSFFSPPSSMTPVRDGDALLPTMMRMGLLPDGLSLCSTFASPSRTAAESIIKENNRFAISPLRTAAADSGALRPSFAAHPPSPAARVSTAPASRIGRGAAAVASNAYNKDSPAQILQNLTSKKVPPSALVFAPNIAGLGGAPVRARVGEEGAATCITGSSRGAAATAAREVAEFVDSRTFPNCPDLPTIYALLCTFRLARLRAITLNNLSCVLRRRGGMAKEAVRCAKVAIAVEAKVGGLVASAIRHIYTARSAACSPSRGVGVGATTGSNSVSREGKASGAATTAAFPEPTTTFAPPLSLSETIGANIGTAAVLGLDPVHSPTVMSALYIPPSVAVASIPTAPEIEIGGVFGSGGGLPLSSAVDSDSPVVKRSASNTASSPANISIASLSLASPASEVTKIISDAHRNVAHGLNTRYFHILKTLQEASEGLAYPRRLLEESAAEAPNVGAGRRGNSVGGYNGQQRAAVVSYQGGGTNSGGKYLTQNSIISASSGSRSSSLQPHRRGGSLQQQQTPLSPPGPGSAYSDVLPIRWSPFLCTAMTNLSALYVQLGRYAEGLGFAAEAVAMFLTYEQAKANKTSKATKTTKLIGASSVLTPSPPSSSSCNSPTLVSAKSSDGEDTAAASGVGGRAAVSEGGGDGVGQGNSTQGLGAVVFQNLAIAMEPLDPHGSLDAYAESLFRAKQEFDHDEDNIDEQDVCYTSSEGEDTYANNAVNKSNTNNTRRGHMAMDHPLIRAIRSNRDRYMGWLKERHELLVAPFITSNTSNANTGAPLNGEGNGKPTAATASTNSNYPLLSSNTAQINNSPFFNGSIVAAATAMGVGGGAAHRRRSSLWNTAILGQFSPRMANSNSATTNNNPSLTSSPRRPLSGSQQQRRSNTNTNMYTNNKTTIVGGIGTNASASAYAASLMASSQQGGGGGFSPLRGGGGLPAPLNSMAGSGGGALWGESMRQLHQAVSALSAATTSSTIPQPHQAPSSFSASPLHEDALPFTNSRSASSAPPTAADVLVLAENAFLEAQSAAVLTASIALASSIPVGAPPLPPAVGVTVTKGSAPSTSSSSTLLPLLSLTTGMCLRVSANSGGGSGGGGGTNNNVVNGREVLASGFNLNQLMALMRCVQGGTPLQASKEGFGASSSPSPSMLSTSSSFASMVTSDPFGAALIGLNAAHKARLVQTALSERRMRKRKEEKEKEAFIPSFFTQTSSTFKAFDDKAVPSTASACSSALSMMPFPPIPTSGEHNRATMSTSARHPSARHMFSHIPAAQALDVGRLHRLELYKHDHQYVPLFSAPSEKRTQGGGCKEAFSANSEIRLSSGEGPQIKSVVADPSPPPIPQPLFLTPATAESEKRNEHNGGFRARTHTTPNSISYITPTRRDLVETPRMNQQEAMGGAGKAFYGLLPQPPLPPPSSASLGGSVVLQQRSTLSKSADDLVRVSRDGQKESENGGVHSSGGEEESAASTTTAAPSIAVTAAGSMNTSVVEEEKQHERQNQRIFRGAAVQQRQTHNSTTDNTDDKASSHRQDQKQQGATGTLTSRNVVTDPSSDLRCWHLDSEVISRRPRRRGGHKEDYGKNSSRAKETTRLEEERDRRERQLQHASRPAEALDTAFAALLVEVRTPLQIVGSDINKKDEAAALAAAASAATTSAASNASISGGGAHSSTTSAGSQHHHQPHHAANSNSISASGLTPAASAAYGALGVMPLVLRPSALAGVGLYLTPPKDTTAANNASFGPSASISVLPPQPSSAALYAAAARKERERKAAQSGVGLTTALPHRQRGISSSSTISATAGYMYNNPRPTTSSEKRPHSSVSPQTPTKQRQLHNNAANQRPRSSQHQTKQSPIVVNIPGASAATQVVHMARREPRPLAPMPVTLLEEARRGDDLLALLSTRLGALLRHEENYHYKYEKARRIQCLWRRVLASRELNKRRRLRQMLGELVEKVRNKASMKITNFFRGLLEAKYFEAAQRAETARVAHQEDRAATVLQKYSRRWIAKRKVERARERYERRIRHITIIQRLFRARRARILVAEQRGKKRTEAALILKREREHNAAAKIQATMRCHWALIEKKLSEGDCKGALRMDRQKYRDWAARLIQRQVRGFLVRKVYGKQVHDAQKIRKNKDRTAVRRKAQIVIAAAWRGYAVRSKSPHDKVMRTARANVEQRKRLDFVVSVVKIQTQVRIMLAKKELARRKALRESALLEEKRAWHKSERRW